jgi:hypothetical protein
VRIIQPRRHQDSKPVDKVRFWFSPDLCTSISTILVLRGRILTTDVRDLTFCTRDIGEIRGGLGLVAAPPRWGSVPLWFQLCRLHFTTKCVKGDTYA